MSVRSFYDERAEGERAAEEAKLEKLRTVIRDLTQSYRSSNGMEDQVCFWCGAPAKLALVRQMVSQWAEHCDHDDGCPYVKALKVLEER